MNDSVIVKDVTTSEFKQFVLSEMIKIVVKMNSLRFRTVYWVTCDKYYHIAIWVYLKISKLWEKWRKKPDEIINEEDDDKDHSKHFNLLKPLSRFYHFINLSGIVSIWLGVNLTIAVLVKYEKANEGISVSSFIIGVIIAALIGHVLIMCITKLLHILYMKNIEDAFSEKKLDINLHKKQMNDTQKSEAVPMLNNEFKESNFETKNSINKWENSSKSSSTQKLDTARQMVSSNSMPGSGSQKSNIVRPVLSESDDDHIIEKKTFLGDTEVLNDESKRSNNIFNTFIFMVLLGFIAFLTLFSWFYTYHEYSQSVILSCILMVIISTFVEVLFLRPFTCLILTLFTMIKRKVKSKEIMMREIEEVKEELGLNNEKSKEFASDKRIESLQDSKEKFSKSHDLEGSQDR